MSTAHSSDDALSASLDGEADPHDAAHIVSCPSCQRRVEDLRRVVASVAAPVDAWDPTARDEAVAAAVAVASAPAGGSVSSLADHRERRSWWQSPRVLGVAAAVAAILIAVPLLVGGGNRDDTDSTAFRDRSSDSEEKAAAPAPLEDLGPVADAQALAATLQPRLADAALQAPSAAPAAGSEGGAAAGTGGATGGDAAGGVAPGGAADGGTAEDFGTSPPPEAATGPSAARSVAQAQEGVAAARRCEDDLRSNGTEIGETRYRALVTYQGRPAVVLGFVGTRPTITVVFVLAEADCSIIVSQRFGS